VHPDLVEFWREAEHADLFADAKYGQWGLRVLSLAQALGRTVTWRANQVVSG
jgi:hypothetical protein